MFGIIGTQLGALDCRRRGKPAFTMTELVVVVLIISLFISMVQINLYGLLTRDTFGSQAQRMVEVMQMVSAAAAENGKRYEVIIDLTEQNYLVREITSSDLSEVLEEEIIAENDFSDNCGASYVLFDDGDYATEGRAKFRVGCSGWQYGGRIVLLDRDNKPYSVIVNRLNRIIILKEGEVGLLTPKSQDEIPF